MSDPNLLTQRQIQELQDGHERLRKADVPAFYLPWSQRAVNPFPAVSSGLGFADQAQPWSANLIAWYCTVFVVTTNNASNYWVLSLVDSASSTITTLSTSAIAANTWTRLSTTTFSQPATSNAVLSIVATTILAPGSIYIVPALALLRTGN